MRHIPERKRAKQTGKGRAPSFLLLPHYLLDSEEFAALSAVAVKLLLEIARQFKGTNNGNISIPWAQLHKRGWSSQWTVRRARDELITAGFVRITRHGGSHLCALYAITWQPVDECASVMLEIGPEKVASNAWKKREGHCHHGSDSAKNAATTAAKAA